jgi:Protein of unknown function (DUF3800)
MNFEVYCDESGLEALARKDAHRYIVIGGIWFPSDYRKQFKAEFETIRQRNNVHGELKWSKVSPRYEDIYKEVIDYFFRSNDIRFRAIVIESSKVDHVKFNSADAELGFYKFYYQLLHHWIYDFNSYDIFVDLKVNRSKGRLKDLERVLERSNLTSDIKQVQGLPSEQSVGIQMADILTGLVSTKFNNEATGCAKLSLIKHLEENHLHKPIFATPKWQEKFNIFKINLQGGW